jgi:hypothetical protein
VAAEAPVTQFDAGPILTSPASISYDHVVEAKGTCYPGVQVSIGAAMTRVHEALIGMRFQRKAESCEVELIGLAAR